MTPAQEIWIWVPRGQNGAILPTAGELLSEGSALARRLNLRLVALSDRACRPDEVDNLSRWGVGEIRTLDGPLSPHPTIRNGKSPLAHWRSAAPQVFLLSDDPWGKVVAPLRAAETGAVFVPAVTGITASTASTVAASGGRIVLTRPVLEEQQEALVYPDEGKPLVATLIPGSVGASEPTGDAPHRDISQARQQTAAESSLPTTRIFPPDPATLAVEDAERIVAFGRGAFDPEALRMIERLAELLGAVIAGSRPAADEGWLPFSRQVGLTGAIVRPKLYLAIGISGAPYHMVGIKDPETLIAINNDPEAPIFGCATLGIVGDLHGVLPELIGRLERGEPLAERSEEEPAGSGKHLEGNS